MSALQKGELKRLREIEALLRKLVADPLWGLRTPEYEDADALRRLVGLEEDAEREDLRRRLSYSERRCRTLQQGIAQAKDALTEGEIDEAYEALGIASVRSGDLRRAFERLTTEEIAVTIERHPGPPRQAHLTLEVRLPRNVSRPPCRLQEPRSEYATRWSGGATSTSPSTSPP